MARLLEVNIKIVSTKLVVVCITFFMQILCIILASCCTDDFHMVLTLTCARALQFQTYLDTMGSNLGSLFNIDELRCHLKLFLYD